MLTDGRTTDAGVTGILIAHLGAFGSGELKREDPNYVAAFVQPRQSLCCLHTQNIDVNEDSGQI